MFGPFLARLDSTYGPWLTNGRDEGPKSEQILTEGLRG